jgi:hypothetical protein
MIMETNQVGRYLACVVGGDPDKMTAVMNGVVLR